MAKKKKTLFDKPKTKYIAKIVKFDNPTSAKKSANKLITEFGNAKTMPKRLRLARSARKAANMADATLKRKNLSHKEREEYREIEKIYSSAASIMFEQYNEMKKYKKRK